MPRRLVFPETPTARAVTVGWFGTKGLTTRTKDTEILYCLESSTLGKRYGYDGCRWGGCAVSWHCHAVRRCTHPAKRANCCAAGRSAQRVSTRGANPSDQTARTAQGDGNGTGTGTARTLEPAGRAEPGTWGTFRGPAKGRAGGAGSAKADHEAVARADGPLPKEARGRHRS